MILPPFIFSALAAGLLSAVAVLAFQRKAGPAFVVVAAAGLSGAFGQIDRISEFSAGLQSLTIKIREADDVLSRLRKLAALTSKELLTLEEGKVNTNLEQSIHRDQLREDLKSLYADLSMNAPEITELNRQLRRSVALDYMSHIVVYLMSRPEIRTMSDPNKLFVDLQSVWDGTNPPDPERLSTVLSSYFPDSSILRRVVSDYRTYFATGSHSDPALWQSRDSWASVKQ